mmetsp:Transcript_14280/g.39418  ORF Transcript_14280/g.39418 Transcript_14280/m.39418 type:complete len:366 (+) Transcript_14280:46-1143(+)
MPVLKICYRGDAYRVIFDGDLDARIVDEAVQKLCPGLVDYMLRFQINEGNGRAFNEARSADFVKIVADLASEGRQMWKLEVLPSFAPAQAQPLPAGPRTLYEVPPATPRSLAEDDDTSIFARTGWAFLESSQESPLAGIQDWHYVVSAGAVADQDSEGGETEPRGMPVSQTDDEVLLEVERIKAACVAELRRHLTEWLLVNVEQPRYEDWIRAVHPENVAEEPCGRLVIDARLYLKDSLHRKLWNEYAVDGVRLDPEEKQRRYVVGTGCHADIPHAHFSEALVHDATDLEGNSSHWLGNLGALRAAISAHVLAAPFLIATDFAMTAGLLTVPLVVTPIVLYVGKTLVGSRRSELDESVKKTPKKP